MKCYRLKHIPTGLYFILSRKIKIKWKDASNNKRVGYVKSNLSKKGKVYLRPPNINHYTSIYNHLTIQKKLDGTSRNQYELGRLAESVSSEDWLIEEVN